MIIGVEERSRYYAERIARTEMARAWAEGFWAEYGQDDLVAGVKWKLSSRHGSFDICDFHAHANIFGLGAGVFPKGKSPSLPAHPHCLCHLVPIYFNEIGTPDHDNVKRRGDEWLNEQDESQRQRLMTIDGEQAWRNGEDWQKHLRQWGGNVDQRTRLGKSDFEFKMQRFASAADYRDLIGTAAYPLKVRRQVQNRHIEGTEEFKRYESILAPRHYRPSKLAINAQTIVDQFHKQGQLEYDDEANVLSEKVDVGIIAGQYWNHRQQRYLDSQLVNIVYSKRGTHVYPIYPGR